jgi:hypothetical protein
MFHVEQCFLWALQRGSRSKPTAFEPWRAVDLGWAEVAVSGMDTKSAAGIRSPPSQPHSYGPQPKLHTVKRTLSAPVLRSPMGLCESGTEEQTRYRDGH